MGICSYIFKRTILQARYRQDLNISIEITNTSGNRVCVNERRVDSIITEEIYWQNGYPIHQWFVTNALGGEDDEDEHRIEREDLENLLQDCRTALETGDTDIFRPYEMACFEQCYDDAYWEDIRQTMTDVSATLDAAKVGDVFYYQANW